MPLQNVSTNDELIAKFVETTRGLFSGKRLLLVEDMWLNREIINTLLSESGLSIDEAEDGLEAFAIIKSYPERYHLVFMDIEMPKMDGLEATRQIRSLPSEGAKSIPIVAMTGNDDREDVEKCFIAGMNDHIAKPIDVDYLLAIMKKYLCE